MIETRIKPVEVKPYLSVLECKKDTPKEVLYEFAITYLRTHTYVNSKKLAIYYLCEVYEYTPTRFEYNKVRKSLSMKFKCVITKLLHEKRIVRYSPKLYKRVDLDNGHLLYDGISFKNGRY